MKIESIIRRKGGSRVTLGQITYHFAPDDEGRHVADVEDKDHITRLLAITEGFRPADGGEPPVPADSPVPTSEDAKTLEPNAGEGEGDDEGEDEGNDDPSGDEKAAASDADEREAAAQAYQEKFGSRPHGRWTTERILAELADEAEQGE